MAIIAVALLVATGARAQSPSERQATEDLEECIAASKLARTIAEARDAGMSKAGVIAVTRRVTASQGRSVADDEAQRGAEAKIDFVYSSGLGADAVAEEAFRACQSGATP
jgi:hypothetical protein